MFRLAAEFASAKFRLLSGRTHRVAPSAPPPLSEVRQPRSPSKPQIVRRGAGTLENDRHGACQLTASPGRPGGAAAVDRHGQTVPGPRGLDGSGDSAPSEGQRKGFGATFLQRLRRGPREAPFPPQEVNKEEQPARRSRESPSILEEQEKADSRPPTNNQSECKAGKCPIRARIGRILRMFHRPKVAPLGVTPPAGREPPTPAALGGRASLHLELHNGCCRAGEPETHSEDHLENGDALDPNRGCHTACVEFETLLRSSLTDLVTTTGTETSALHSVAVAPNNEPYDRGDADILENEHRGGLPSATRPCSCGKLQSERPGCSPEHVGVASEELPEASVSHESFADKTSLTGCRSPTPGSPRHGTRGSRPAGGRARTLGSLSAEEEITEENPVRRTSPAQGLSSPILPQGATSEAAPRRKNVLGVKPDVLADEMRTLSPGTRQRQIQAITAHSKRRVDLQTLTDVTSATSPTSDEGQEIQETARRSETLLSQSKAVMTKTEKRVSDRTEEHLPVTPQTHRSTSSNLSGHCGQNGSSGKPRRLSGVTCPMHQSASTPRPKVSSVKQSVPTHPAPNPPGPSKPKTATICPAINTQTFRKSPVVPGQGSPARPASADLQALGLPIIQEQDLEPVRTKTGTVVMLGSGDYGEVFLARSRADSTPVAVKRLTDLGRASRGDGRTDKMVREIRAMEAVRSCRVFPNFLGVLDTFSFAQEFAGNPRATVSLSAFRLLYKSPRGPHLLPLDWVRVCVDVAEGLQALHGAGWTHNDLHVGNILVWRDPQKLTATWGAKIIDLGNASLIRSPPPPKTLSYAQMMYAFQNCGQMAPEIVEGRSRYNVKSDVYSFGVALQEIGKENRLLSGFNTMGDRCMVKEPDQRPELKTVLEELIGLCDKFVCPRRAGKPKRTQ